MKLRDYILKNHNGRNIDFAVANDMTAQQVGQMIKKGIYYIYDGMLVIARKNVNKPKEEKGDSHLQDDLLK